MGIPLFSTRQVCTEGAAADWTEVLMRQVQIPDQPFFTTAEVAKLDESCERLVNRLFDAHRIDGFWDEQFRRRIPRQEVVRFLVEGRRDV
jgi:hypothetical protein